MKQYNNIQKISTGISGLDKILLGGLQLPMYSTSTKNDIPGIIITIKGCRGTDKTMLAMQIMHGISKSLRRFNGEDDFLPPCFYSLNKTQSQLDDMLLDFIISQCTHKLVLLKQDKRKEFKYCNSLFADVIFNTNIEVYIGREQDENTPQLPDDLYTHLDKYISEGIVFYNIRTNSLHFLTSQQRDSQANMLFVRRHNSVQKYLSCINRFSDDYSELDDFKNDFFDVQFISADEDESDPYTYSKTPAYKFSQIVSKIQERQNPNKDLSSAKMVPCTVVDGISLIKKRELEGFELSSIEKLLRLTSLVSIVVVDDLEEDIFHSDLTIEMRRVENESVNYTSHQLRINKSVFQMTAYGWHQYKKRDHGIEVYPSSHLLLHQKRYLSQSIINTTNGLLECNYLQYLQFSKKLDDKKQFVAYENDRKNDEYNKLRELYVNRIYRLDATPSDILGYLFGFKDTVPDGKTIAIIGNPNTYKRYLAIGSSFCAAKKGYHTLFLTFDRLSSNMLQQMQCPALVAENLSLPCVEKADDGTVKYKNSVNRQCSNLCPHDCVLKDCKYCYDYLHSFNINMGCISADELLHYLDEQLHIYFDKQGSNIKRIIFDDLQKIDFCFPLLKSNRLFLAALKSFCQKRGVDLIILCDRKAGLVDELVSLSENVVFMHRGIDSKEVSFLIEKFSGNIQPSQIFNIKTLKIESLFECNRQNCTISSSACNVEEVGSVPHCSDGNIREIE